jgi:hypothetical protein
MHQLKQMLLEEKNLLLRKRNLWLHRIKDSSTEEIQFLDVSTQTDAPRREEFAVEEKESKTTQKKSVSFTEEIQFLGVQLKQMLLQENNLLLAVGGKRNVWV